ncbi:MAG TPA: hypothetical protein VGE24_04890, partial [Emticicia sp.]
TYTVSAGILFIIGFSFSIIKVYQEYFASNKLFFFIVLLAMLLTTATVCVSFFVDKTLSKNWYKVVVGTMAIAVLDIYVYLSLFVFVTYTDYLFTIGKLIFSVGFILIVDRTMRGCLNKAPLMVRYRKTPRTV